MSERDVTEKQKLLDLPFIPYILLFIAIVAVSFAAIIVVKLNEYNIPSEVSAMYRTLFAGVGALLLALPKNKVVWIGQKTTIQRFHWIILSGLFLAIHFATWFLSLNYVSVAISTTLVDTVPIFLAILGFIFFREKVNIYGVIGIILSVSGGIALSMSTKSSPEHTNPIVGIVLSLFGAITVSFYFIIGKKILSDSPLWPYFAVVNIVSGLSLLFYNLFRHYPLGWQSAKGFIFLLLLALVPSLIGHATYNYCLKKLPAYVVGVSILGEPIGATILGIIFLAQVPDPLTVLFAGIILLGIALTSVSPYIKKRMSKNYFF